MGLTEGTTFEINSGADLSLIHPFSPLVLASGGGNGTLVVDGLGSSVTAGGQFYWRFGEHRQRDVPPAGNR